MHFLSPAQPHLDDVGKFLSEMGAAACEPAESLKLAAGRLPEELQVVVLQMRQ